MRGKEMLETLVDKWGGITPAYAGKRRKSQPRTLPGWDHPRVCGEKSNGISGSSSPMGSPPRMRGKDRHRVAVAYGNRITPAYAGKRAGACARGASTRDHPRVCGEKSRPFSGSPPRMRGKVARFFVRALQYRITPAYAGKSSAVPLRLCASRDYPHICGEKA